MELTQEKLLEIAETAEAIGEKTAERQLMLQYLHLGGVARNIIKRVKAAAEKDAG